MQRKWCAAATAVVVMSALVVDRAVADDFWRTAARGLQFAGWAAPTGDIGVRKHLFGNGWNIDTTRSLSDWELYGGAVGIQFSSTVDPTTGLVLPVSLDTSLKVRQWVIPTASLRVATDRTGTKTPVPVAYNMWFTTGAQNVEITGEGSLEADVQINALGFYNVQGFISNRGQLTVDGVLYADTKTLDYDLGPISIQGNVFADLLSAVTQPIFTATNTDNPFSVFSGRVKLDGQIKQRDELVARLSAGETLSDEEMNEIITTSLLASVLGGENGDPLALVTNMFTSSENGSAGDQVEGLTSPVAEPLSVGCWLALAGAAGISGRRRR